MKVIKVFIVLGLLVASQVSAEPYAEWGVLTGGIPLSELDPDMQIPDSSEVPIPPPPGGVFISVSGDKFCSMVLRTKVSIEDACSFYRSKLGALGYRNVDTGLGPGEDCDMYMNGDIESNLGVMVYKNEDPAYLKNGSTMVAINYLPPDSQECWK